MSIVRPSLLATIAVAAGLLVSTARTALAQPAAPAADSPAPPAAQGAPAAAAAQPAPPPPPPPDPNAAQLRATCSAALNADPSFAIAIVKTLSEKSARDHIDRAHYIAKNERHVIIAYAAMWLLSIGFVAFLWRRQAGLKAQIDGLRRELERAEKA